MLRDCSSNCPDAPTPAHVTKRSGAPADASVCAIAADTESGSLMSQVMSPPLRSQTTPADPAAKTVYHSAADTGRPADHYAAHAGARSVRRGLRRER